MIDDEIIESFVNCKYKAYRKLNNEHSIKTEFEILQEDQLSICKTEFYKRLSEKHGENNLLKGYNFGKNRRVPRTDVIIQPTLRTETHQISFDAIEINPDKKSNSKKIQIPILVSSKEKISKIEKLSIAIKCIILSKTCGAEYEFGKIIYGSDLKTVKFKIEPFITEAKKTLNELHKISKGEFQSLIFHKNHCKICEFQEMCQKELVEKDSLGLLHRMGEREIRRYNNKGIFTVKQLSYTFRLRKRGNRVKTKQRPYYLSLQALAIREQKVYLYDKVDLPDAKTKIFIDMEGNTDGSFIYLIGVLIVQDNKEKKHSLWANNPSDEEEIFAKLIAILTEYNDGYVFYFGKYESRVFRRLLKFDSSDKIENLIRDRSINVLDLIYSNIYFPTYSNELKAIGNYLGCSWSAPNASGIQSIVWRKKWKRSKDTKLKDTLIKYNVEDCTALKILTEFIYSICIKTTSDDSDKKLENIALANDLKSHDERPNYGPLNYVSSDIEVITKCAYFEYQRNKIYLRTNKNFKRINKRKTAKKNFKYNFNKIIAFTSYRCPYCKSKNFIQKEKNSYTKVCLDLKISKYGIKKRVIKYSSSLYYCLSCKKRFLPKKFQKIYLYSRRRKLDKRKDKQMIHNEKGVGHNLLSWSVYQLVVNKNSLTNISKNFRDYFKLPVTFQDIWALKITAANYYQTTYKKSFEKIVKGNLIHSDETTVRLKKENGYVWVFTNMEEVFYFYKPTRESDFLHDLLKGFNGVIVTDFYSGYDSLKCSQQKCLVHLIRDLNDALLKNPLDDELKDIVIRFGCLLRKIIETIDKFGLKSRYLKKHKKDVKRFYKWLLTQNFNSEIAESFQKRMTKYEKKLFTFLEYDNIPWNNNNAEHAVKYFAKYRRLVNGQLNQRGLEAYLVLLSIYQTCEYKGINFLDFLLSKEKDIDEFMRKH